MDPIFRLRVQRFASLSNGCFYCTPEDLSSDTPQLRRWRDIEHDRAASARVQWPGIKGVKDATRKLDLHYDQQLVRLHDVVRGRIIFTSLADILDCLMLVAEDPQIEIVSVTNGFDTHYDVQRTAGYRDVKLVVRIISELTVAFGVSSHTCELQLAHKDMASLITPAEHHRYQVSKS